MSLTDSEATLARLASRPDVQSTLILSRTSGAVLKVSGKLAESDGDAERDEGLPRRRDGDGRRARGQGAEGMGTDGSGAEGGMSRGGGGGGGQAGGGEGREGGGIGEDGIEKETETEKPISMAEEYAAMVWRFLGACEAFVGAVERDDDMRLLRLRTRKYEMMVVPDENFVLVVVHDVPKG